ncbi:MULTISPECIES: hypothetical protein [unclassified Archaeoglobus]|jgi:hypothetical protein|uniref:hypothetical protein n=1 Tax=unclassified Archaeoglobus TaxID=2643606 RepID=UPI0025C20768|nr:MULTISPECIES: hypothetical protein [unclassified Archaeoglobus]
MSGPPTARCVCTCHLQESEFHRQALELTDNPARFNDMVILAVAERYGKLATYDKRLRKDAARLGIKVEL